MAFAAKGDLKLGFWVGLGLMIAFAAWALATGLFGKLRGSVGG
jgi:hypothetical protein